MRIKFVLISLGINLFFNLSSFAQCPIGRYLYNPLFTNYSIVTDTYSTVNPDTFLVDIYQPVGDTQVARPLLILAHGGSFIDGTRIDDSTIIWLCRNFALRGFVTASIDYRLGDAISMFIDSNNAINEVFKAISDGKAAIRFFVKDRATINKYKIDTNNIFIGGNSAGAVLAMNLGYIDSMGECPANLVTAMNNNGGFEGNSGNAGYTTRFKGIVNLAGGVNHVSFIGAGDKPSVNAQGTLDSIVPYFCGYPNFGGGLSINVTLCGLGSCEPQYNSEGIFHLSHIFPGQGHVPWQNGGSMFVTVDSLVQVFLYDMICTKLDVSNQNNNIPEISLYPNPAFQTFAIKSNQSIKEILMLDEVGSVVYKEDLLNSFEKEVNVCHLTKGIYWVKVLFENCLVTPMVMRLVVE